MPLVEAVRQQAERLSDRDPAGPHEPLAYAWLSCLEAAVRVGRALEAQRGPRRLGTDAGTAAEEQREALSATRGAAAAVRFLLYGTDEPARRIGEPIRARDADAA